MTTFRIRQQNDTRWIVCAGDGIENVADRGFKSESAAHAWTVLHRDGVVWTQDELLTAFNNVSDPEDWRGPIDANVDPKTDNVPLLVQAVIHFTACSPTLAELPDGTWQLQADGYRCGPAGP